MHAHIRIPPDSTGKRVHGRAFLDVNYTNLTGTLYLRDTVTFGTSGMGGILSDWIPSSGTAGVMHIILTADSAELTMTPGETLTFSGGATTTAVSGINFFDNAAILTGKTVDSWLEIDSRGAAYTRYAEGSPLMDPYGNTKSSESTIIGSYPFDNGLSEDLFTDTVTGGGAVSLLSDSSSVNLSVGATNGDSANRTSDKYHFYLPGRGTSFTMSVALSDSNHTGCVRKWGAFDASNGMMFNLDAAGALSIISRGTTSGSLTNVSYTRQDWNGDRLDGSGESNFDLDLTQINTYWIDVLYGVRQRFGVYDQFGNRIVCHTILIANNSIRPLMRSASLPLSFNITNTSATGGAASMRITNASVTTEGKLDYTYWRYVHSFPSVSVTGNNIYCMSVRSLATIGTDHNTVSAYPESLNVYVDAGVVKIDVYWDYMTLTGSPSFVGDNGSTIMSDIAATGATLDGTEYKPATFYVGTGAHNLDLIKYFDKVDLGICARADEGTPQYVTIIATKISGTPTLIGSLHYAEVS